MKERSKIGSITLQSAWWTTRSRKGCGRDQAPFGFVDVEAGVAVRADSVCDCSSSCKAEQIVLQPVLERGHIGVAALALGGPAIGQQQIVPSAKFCRT